MKVALVHDHLDQIGGAENVLKAMHEVFPDAPIYTLIYNKKAMGSFCDGWDIRTSFIQKMPGSHFRFKPFLPFMPTAFERMNLSEYDVIISDSSAFSKGVITRPTTMHLNYCHTPTRYLWHDTHSYTAELPTNPIFKWMLPFVLNYLRTWDRVSADRPDFMYGNSKAVSERIKKYYGRTVKTLYPPVKLGSFDPIPVEEVGNYFLIGGRFRPYKRFDLAIQAFTKIGVPLKVFGQGEEEKRLRRLAGPNIEFLGPVSDKEKDELYLRAQAFLHPAEEDFGITPLESMAHGRPVIAYGAGGALETIKPGVTGEFFEHQTVDSLMHVLRNFDFKKYDPTTMKEHALTFREEVFKQNIKNIVELCWEEYQTEYPQLFTKPN